MIKIKNFLKIKLNKNMTEKDPEQNKKKPIETSTRASLSQLRSQIDAKLEAKDENAKPKGPRVAKLLDTVEDLVGDGIRSIDKALTNDVLGDEDYLKDNLDYLNNSEIDKLEISALKTEFNSKIDNEKNIETAKEKEQEQVYLQIEDAVIIAKRNRLGKKDDDGNRIYPNTLKTAHFIWGSEQIRGEYEYGTEILDKEVTDKKTKVTTTVKVPEYVKLDTKESTKKLLAMDSPPRMAVYVKYIMKPYSEYLEKLYNLNSSNKEQEFSEKKAALESEFNETLQKMNQRFDEVKNEIVQNFDYGRYNDSLKEEASWIRTIESLQKVEN